MEDSNIRKTSKQKKSKLEDEYTIKSPALTDESTNPCIKEGNLTQKCMHLNNFVAANCYDVFENYRLCQRFWKLVSWDRCMAGKYPLLPPVEEREEVKKYTIKKYKPEIRLKKDFPKSWK